MCEVELFLQHQIEAGGKEGRRGRVSKALRFGVRRWNTVFGGRVNAVGVDHDVDLVEYDLTKSLVLDFVCADFCENQEQSMTIDMPVHHALLQYYYCWYCHRFFSSFSFCTRK